MCAVYVCSVCMQSVPTAYKPTHSYSVCTVRCHLIPVRLCVSDPDRAGDGTAGRRAPLVQAPDPRRLLAAPAPCLPQHPAQAAPRGEPHTPATEYVAPPPHPLLKGAVYSI